MYKVLIIEDDPMVAMINEQYINRNKKFHVTEKFRDGKSCLAYLEDHEADLIILDVFMPVMDGFETLRQIRKKKISVDVIMVTAANDRADLEEAIHLGVVDYLVKPFSYDRFQIALEKFIAQNDAFKDLGTLNQKNIDHIIENTRKKGEEIFPKGIQEKTLCMILAYLRESGDQWLAGDSIAQKIGLTAVTVRRYMNYLAEKGQVIGEMNYETGGRPCMRYKISEAE